MGNKTPGRSNKNPRQSNRTLRQKYRARFEAMGAPCGICRGLYGRIHYEEPSDSKHPFSFVIDEIIPVSKWEQAGYASPRAAAEDFGNLQAAHYICNQRKGARVDYHINKTNELQPNPKKNFRLDGKW